MSFECLRDQRANLCFAGLAPVLIPDVSGMCQATIKFLLFSGWFVGSFDMSQKFRRSGVQTMVGSFDALRLTDSDGSLSWSGMDDQRPTTSFQMP